MLCSEALTINVSVLFLWKLLHLTYPHLQDGRTAVLPLPYFIPVFHLSVQCQCPFSGEEASGAKKSIIWSLPSTTAGLQQSITSHVSLVFSIINIFTYRRQLCATFEEAEHVAILVLLMKGREKVLCGLPGRKLFSLMYWQVLNSIEKGEPFLPPPNTCSPWETWRLTFSSDQLVPGRPR